MKWIPRAEHLSRIIDFDDYAINDDVFQILDVPWGPHTIDRFACSYNAKLSRFHSRFYQPGTEAVDAFSVYKTGSLRTNGYFLQFPKLRELSIV